MALTAGTRLGHYDVTSLIGEGGMGQVWQATDTQLNRQVALKILPDAFSADPDRLARFTREAQILASLNHPNIAAIHGIEEAERTRALVLELVEGPTLADRIAKGPIPVDEALPIAKQIAEALEAAHEAGVIHRDLKPANIKVREDGTVKVLDFGLAKALAGDAQAADLSQSPTVTAAGTREGVILGTAAYMSPEQARGKPLDKRTDIWSFGCVLFEMLTGQAAFGALTVSDTIANVLGREPTWGVLPAGTPAAVGTLMRRCLHRSAGERLRDIGDARVELNEASGLRPKEQAGKSSALGAPAVWQQALPWVAGVVLAVVTGFAVSILGRPAPQLARYLITPPRSSALSVSFSRASIALTPDGSRMVYRGSVRGATLFVRPVADIAVTPLVSNIPDPPDTPFISPDSAWVGFIGGTTGTLKKVSILGGPEETICDCDAFGASWGADGRIIFSKRALGGGLWRVLAAGGEPERLTTPDAAAGERNHRWPDILPGGEAALYTVVRDGLRNAEIALLMLANRESRVLIPGGSYARLRPHRHIASDGAGVRTHRVE